MQGLIIFSFCMMKLNFACKYCFLLGTVLSDLIIVNNSHKDENWWFTNLIDQLQSMSVSILNDFETKRLSLSTVRSEEYISEKFGSIIYFRASATQKVDWRFKQLFHVLDTRKQKSFDKILYFANSITLLGMITNTISYTQVDQMVLFLEESRPILFNVKK